MKYFLHITKKQLRQRLKRLRSDPQTSWRVTEDDELYVINYKPLTKSIEQTLRLTSPGHAPWVVVEAADRHYRELVVAQSLLSAMKSRLASSRASGKSRTVHLSVVPPDGRSILSTLDLTNCVASSRTYPDQLEALQGKVSGLTRAKEFAKRALVLAFEGSDAAGKGGTIRRVAQGVDPRLYRIVPIAKPTDEEAARPYLWRLWRHIPRNGRVTIFDRSWYGRVLVERVENLCDEADWRRAYGEIVDFEAELVSAGVIIVKFWLAMSKQEQLRRFKERERQLFNRFKITKEDWRNRERWQDYERAVVEMVARTSTDIAPWTLVEAEDKNFAHLKVVRTICQRIEEAL